MKLLDYKLMWNKVFELQFEDFSIKHDLIMLEPNIIPSKDILDSTTVVFNNLCYKIEDKNTKFYKDIVETVRNQILEDWHLNNFKNYLKEKPTISGWRINWLDPDVFHLRISENSDTLFEFSNIDNFHMKGIELEDSTLNEIKIETVRILGDLQ